MKLRRACGYLIATVAFSIGVFPDKMTAQISSDGSLSTTVSTDDAVNFLIEGGARSLDNLFHSFGEFSIPNFGSAYFNNATDITNIFSRVTGGSISEIQGLIRANGTANLFLINPAGIVFGENASLDVGGSFFASTAESVVFGDGIEFSATQPEEAPLLTVNITPGLQMGANSGSIIVQGNGHAITGGLFFPVNFNDTAPGLQVNQGETLGLIGNGINLTGGIIRVSGGNIHLSSIEEGILNLNNNSQAWQFDTSEVQSFSNINLSEKSLLDTSGFFTGDIQLQGKNINLEEASVVFIQNLGTQTSGNIAVNATNSVTIFGAVRNAPDQITPLGTITGVIPSQISTQALGTGKAGDIVINGENLFLIDSGRVLSLVYGEGNTADITINLRQLMQVKGFSPLTSSLTTSFPSLVNVSSFGNGDIGEINIYAQNLEVFQGSISSANFGSGQSGDINIQILENLNISDFILEAALSAGIGSTAFGEGNSGNVIINTASLSISNGANLGSIAVAEGNSGKVIVNASESISISGVIPELNLVSRIQSDAPVFDPIPRQTFRLPDQPSGDSGSVTINTPNLTITDGGQVSVSNEGFGNSGDLQINTNQIFLDRSSSINAFSASGQGGNIELNIQDLILLRNSSAITAEATGTLANNQSVDGGNITINSELVTLLEASQINANAFEGNGGNITITTQGLFVSPNSSITASSQFGVDGTITLNTPDEENKLAIAELPANLTDASNQIVGNCSWTRDNTFYVVGRRGIAKTPQEHIQDYTMWSDIRDLSEFESATVIRESSPRQENTIVEANAMIINSEGKVELVAVVPNNNQNLGQVASSCSGLIE